MDRLFGARKSRTLAFLALALLLPFPLPAASNPVLSDSEVGRRQVFHRRALFVDDAHLHTRDGVGSQRDKALSVDSRCMARSGDNGRAQAYGLTGQEAFF